MKFTGEDEWLPPDDPEFRPFVLASVMLTALGGIMSGLQAAMLQLDKPAIQSMRETASPFVASLVDVMEPLILRRHLLLVTLLVSNAAAMEALPIFLDVLFPKPVAIVLSVSMVLLFGEIVPQALALRYPGLIACLFAPLVWILLFLFLPVIYPISKLLDYILGDEHHHIYSRAGFRELAREQAKFTGRGVLEKDELDIITGTLELHDKVARDICIPLEDTFSLSYTAFLTDKILREILDLGHSRVPVWKESKENIVGVLLVKHLIRLNTQNSIQVRDLQIMPLLVVDESVSLFALLRRFRTGTSHMASVTRSRESSPAQETQGSIGRTRSTTESEELIYLSSSTQSPIESIGIVTLEDVIEELLKHDIVDETDRVMPVNQKLDMRMSKVRSVRDDLLSALEAGENTQRSASKTGEPEERDSLLQNQYSSSNSNRPKSLSYGSLNDFMEKTGQKNEDSRHSSTSSTMFQMLQE